MKLAIASVIVNVVQGHGCRNVESDLKLLARSKSEYGKICQRHCYLAKCVHLQKQMPDSVVFSEPLTNKSDPLLTCYPPTVTQSLAMMDFGD